MKLAKASGRLGLAIMAALSANAAIADDDTGWYIGGNYGWTAATIDDERIISSLAARGFTVTDIEDFDEDNGYKVFGGYQFNRYIALEGGYVDLGEYGYALDTVPAGTLTGHIDLHGVNLDLVGTMPLSERFSVFARVGAIYAEADTTFVGTGAVNVLEPNPTASEVDLKFGVGAEYAFTEALSMRVEAERYRIDDAVGNTGDIDMLSAGLVYRFGRHAAPVVAAVAPVVQQTCADLDDDGDGVDNCNDKCPGSTAGQAIGPDGCPVPVSIDLRGVNFDFDRDTLRPDAIAILDEAVSILQKYPQMRFELAGHTDECGSDDYNQGLSERRARVVYDYLASHGIDAGRMSGPNGYGESRPLEQLGDAFPGCKSETNRRTELNVQN
jgi:OOP family OmpA-OmpF porin